MSHSLLLDTDIGTDVDDAVALALALASPEVKITALTTVSGDTQLRARIARRIAQLAGAADLTVAAGHADPLAPGRSFLTLGHEGRGIIEPGDDTAIRDDATDLLIHTVASPACEVVAIGPLTNLALALQRCPELAVTMPRLTLMGGVIGLTADTPASEYNLGSDPEASMLVLQSGIPTTLVPLDVTLQTFFTAADLARLRRSRSPLIQALCDAMEIWWPMHQQLFAGERTYSSDIVCFLHDPLALTTVFEGAFVTTESLALEPQVVDGVFRLARSDRGSTYQVVTAVDAPAFVEFVLDRLLSGG